LPRILLAERDPIRGLIDTDGADQGPPHRSELLRVRRIARHGSGFAFSDRRAIGKAIARRRGSFRALRPEARSAPPESRLCTCGRAAASGAPQDREECRQALREITRPMTSGFPASRVSGFPDCPISR
jgi:hypothetical protein